jgi:ATP/ADP translocase
LSLHFLTTIFSRSFDVRPGEFRRIGFMAAFLFFLLAANNVIKIVRDSLFLSRFPLTQLPYVYLLAAVLAGVVIVIYSRYTAKLPLARVLLGSLAFSISNVILFWLLLTFYNEGWILYAYYMW